MYMLQQQKNIPLFILKSVHIKKTVGRIPFLSKLWHFLFWFVLKVPQFQKKRDSRNCLLKMNGLYMLSVNFQSRNPNFHEFYEIVMRTEKKNYIRLPLICENSEFDFCEKSHNELRYSLALSAKWLHERRFTVHFQVIAPSLSVKKYPSGHAPVF